MNKHDIDKFYVSPYDKLLYTLDRDLPKTESQLKEIRKNLRIAILRDNPNQTEETDPIWETF